MRSIAAQSERLSRPAGRAERSLTLPGSGLESWPVATERHLSSPDPLLLREQSKPLLTVLETASARSCSTVRTSTLRFVFERNVFCGAGHEEMSGELVVVDWDDQPQH
jgi:hypothetical protein